MSVQTETPSQPSANPGNANQGSDAQDPSQNRSPEVVAATLQNITAAGDAGNANPQTNLSEAAAESPNQEEQIVEPPPMPTPQPIKCMANAAAREKFSPEEQEELERLTALNGMLRKKGDNLFGKTKERYFKFFALGRYLAYFDKPPVESSLII